MAPMAKRAIAGKIEAENNRDGKTKVNGNDPDEVK